MEMSLQVKVPCLYTVALLNIQFCGKEGEDQVLP